MLSDVKSISLSASLPKTKLVFKTDVIDVCAPATATSLAFTVIPVPAPTANTELEDAKPAPANNAAMSSNPSFLVTEEPVASKKRILSPFAIFVSAISNVGLAKDGDVKVLFVSVSVVALPTKVSDDVGKVIVPEFDIDEITGVVKSFIGKCLCAC